MLSLPSTFWRSSQQTKVTGSLAEPSRSAAEANGDDIPQDIKEGSISPKRPTGPAIVMSASTARRVSRPLSNRLTAHAQLSGGPKPLPLVPAGQSNNPAADIVCSSVCRPSMGTRASGDLLGCKGVQHTANGRNHAAAAAAIVVAAADSNSSAPSTPRQTDGDTILHGLAQQAQQLQGAGSVQQGADLQSAVATLTKLRTHEGLNLDLLFETLLEARSLSDPAATTAEPGAAMQQKPTSMRMPRSGRQSLARPTENHIVIRLLSPHDKSSDSVALNRIQLHDETGQQCASSHLPSQVVLCVSCIVYGLPFDQEKTCVTVIEVEYMLLLQGPAPCHPCVRPQLSTKPAH